MAANGQVVSVGTSATLIFQVFDDQSFPASPAANDFKAGNPNDPVPILISIPSGSTVVLGGSAVTAAGGCSVVGPAVIPYNAVGNDSLYGIVAASTASVGLLVMRQ